MYEFKEQDAWDFARHVNIDVKQSGKELFFKTCPYCKPRPTNDNIRSFSISLDTGQFKCLRASCGVSGNMITLSKDFDFSLGLAADEYYRPKKIYRKFKTPEKPIVPKPEAIQYLSGRGISEEVIAKYELTVQNEHKNVLVFPFYDENRKLLYVKYRKTDYDKARDSNKEWCEAGGKPILFGMSQCNPENKTLVINEGQLDSLSVATAGIENAVSVPNGAKGFTWIPYCWNWINQFEEIIVFGDYEKGHITLLDELSKRLSIKVKHVREEDYLDCKDANQILLKYGAEQVRKCVENAIPVPVKLVIELADVENVDVFALEKLETGTAEMDRLLYGGLPFGGVTIIAGKPGEGKSTLASQILVNAIHSGYKCLAYSGELPNYLFKAWMDFQIAGPAYTIQYKNRWGDNNYSISKVNREMIADWYRSKCFIYDNSKIEGEEKESLLTTVENAVMQYGIKVVLLDNLMTAIDLEAVEGSDKYDRQSAFVKKLSRIALRHNVLVLLVAHKRKNNFSTNENDEVSGSGDITNLAMVTLSYEKNDRIEQSQRLLKVSKNRLFGRTCKDGWILDYDPKSKRIYGSLDDVNADYGWNKNSSFIPLADDMDSPFN